MFARILLVCLLYPTAALAAPLPKPEAAESGLELRLTTPTSKVKRGQNVRWELTIVNRGKQEMTLVQPGDGSDCGWRTPIIEWLVNGKINGAIEEPEKVSSDTPVRKPELQPACLTGRMQGIARCGNINHLSAQEIVVLKPGQKVTMNSWMGAPDLRNEKGPFKVSVRYFNIPDLKWKGIPLGDHDSKAMDQVKQSNRVALESNVLEIVVED